MKTSNLIKSFIAGVMVLTVIACSKDGDPTASRNAPDLHDYRNLESRARNARAAAGRALDRAQAALDDLARSGASR